jgi:1-acyl-sn-glycerol-3-phosphate acyltransferase
MSKASTGAKQIKEMIPVSGDGDSYQTPARNVSTFSRWFPSLGFYRQWMAIVGRSGARAKRGLYGDYEWYRSSLDILVALESVGVQVEIEGLEHLKALKSPCVIVGNHMSMLETFVLPGILRPLLPVTFVVKESVLRVPVFCHVMRARDPVAVTRTSPREDFAAVMKGGEERLDKGISIVVFPQTTRTPNFDPKEFNSIAIKLARRAGVPVVPLALSTGAWGNGKVVKDFGKIDPGKKVHLAFGEPLDVAERGGSANAEVIRFIEDHLESWSV